MVTSVQERVSGGHLPVKFETLHQILAFWVLLRVLEAFEAGARALFAPSSKSATGLPTCINAQCIIFDLFTLGQELVSCKPNGTFLIRVSEKRYVHYAHVQEPIMQASCTPGV